MNIIDVGAGPPLIIVTGIQGRWEWMKPAVDALAARCRVITFSLADEPTSGGPFDPALGFDNYVRQVGDALDQTGLQRAAVCGVSFGGLIAAAFAARHPDRVSSLILASALPTSWRPSARERMYLHAPWLFAPVFAVKSLRIYGEIAAAAGGRLRGIPIAVKHVVNALTHPTSPSRMAQRVAFWTEAPEVDMSQVSAPTLVVTGEPGLDRVVPVSLTLEYLTLCAQAEAAVVARTGHIGLVTRPAEFARTVGDFVGRHASRTERRRVG